ncbi:MAG: hypothetical protein ACUVSY_10875 [Roseiflexus sp.]
MRHLHAVLIALLCVLPVMPVAAQEQVSGLTLTVRPGYAGAYRLGEWFPITVDVANDGRDIQGVLEWSFPGSQNQPVFRRTVDLPRGSRKRVILEAFAGGFARNGTLRLIENENVLLEQSIGIEAIEPDRFLVVVVGSDPALLTSLSAMQIGGVSGVTVRHILPDDLPLHVLVLRGVNAIFIHDVDTAALSPDQRTALREWVVLGGQLVVGGGINGERAAAGLADLLPVEVTRTLNQGDLMPLAQLGGSEPQPSTGPLVTVVPRPGAEALPPGLIYRGNLGNGVVVFSTFDLALLRGWASEPQLWSRVLRPIPLLAPAFEARVNQISLMQDALQIQAVGLPPASALAAFLLVYILLVGPVNYLALRRIGRLEWAWWTIPLIVTLFAGGVFVVGFMLRGGQAQLYQVAIIQGAERETRGVATAYLALFSPLRSIYALRAPPGSLLSEMRSFDDFTARPMIATADDKGVEVANMLVDVASIRTLISETTVEIPVRVESTIRFDTGDPAGEVRNVGPIALEKAAVVYQGMFQELGDLTPGSGARFDFSSSRGSFPFGITINDDRMFNRRQILFRLFNNPSQTSTRSLLDAQGVYLIGWSAMPAIPLEMNGRSASQQGLTLFVIRLRTA